MVTEKSLEDILTVLLKSTPYTFEQVKDFILIKQRTETEQPEARTSLGVTTGQDGTYRFTIPNLDNCVLEFSFIGMKKKEVEWKGEKELNITLEEDIAEMEEVVVTGIFERKKESFTGSASTFKGEQLKMVSNQNILSGLRSLDPAFAIIENNQYGSDPNCLPDIEIRGKSSIVGFKETFGEDPNQPLFILDGFETDLQTVMDLNSRMF